MCQCRRKRHNATSLRWVSGREGGGEWVAVIDHAPRAVTRQTQERTPVMVDVWAVGLSPVSPYPRIDSTTKKTIHIINIIIIMPTTTGHTLVVAPHAAERRRWKRGRRVVASGTHHGCRGQRQPNSPATRHVATSTVARLVGDGSARRSLRHCDAHAAAARRRLFHTHINSSNSNSNMSHE